MAISPPSDIVLDVAKAVDPQQYAAAAEKLTRAGGSRKTAAASFDRLLNDGEQTAERVSAAAADPSRADLRYRLQNTAHSQAERPAKAYRQFEGFVLQSFIQEMLPKDASHVFGKGIAGNYWSSMLAEQIANQVAEAGGLGIAESIAAKHPASRAVPSIANSQANRAGDVATLHAERTQPRHTRETGQFVAFSTLPGFIRALERYFVNGLGLGGDKTTDTEAA